MTRRFDRLDGYKIHTQTLHAFAGMNFKLPNTYPYEQIFGVLNKMNFDYSAKEQLFRLMVFNIIGRNVDDHTKNFGLNMSAKGVWNLSPAMSSGKPLPTDVSKNTIAEPLLLEKNELLMISIIIFPKLGTIP